jgi:hypothetical protein
MSGIMSMLLGAVSSAAAAVDEFFNRVTLLLPGNGTNGAQNNTFLDSSSNNFTITRNGNTTQGTFSPFSQTGWSNYFDGSSRLTIGSSTPEAVLQLGSGDFTIEMWVYTTSSSAAWQYAISNLNNGVGNLSWSVRFYGSTGVISFLWGTSVSYLGNVEYTSSNNAISPNTWTHVAITRSGSTFRIFANGTQVGTGTSSTAVFSQTQQFYIGATNDNADRFNGYLSNLRVVKGGALYTSSFTPSTTPLTTSVSSGSVSALTCQSNRFIDNSSNALAITVATGTPSVQPFSPFAPAAAYSAATVGGSGYFDGSGDYLSNSSDTIIPSTGDFTAQFWIYPTQVSSLQYLIATTNNSGNKLHLYINSSAYVGVQTGASYRDSSTTKVVANAWNHIACTRTGSTYALFVNGVSQSISGVGTMASTLDVTPTYIAARDAGNGAVSGYLGSSRITTVVETISIPTAPYTSDGNTSLLTNFTNAGITDATAKNVLETVGNAQISTTQSKFGGSSMYFDGTGDYLLSPSSQNFAFPSDFTIEFWLYLTGVSGEGTTFYVPTTGGINLFMSISSNWGIARSGVAVDNNFGTPPTQNTWHHIAVSRTGSTINAYIDGTRVFTGTNSVNYASGSLQVGLSAFGTITGYIDDLRVTKYARYTGSTLTVPTAAFPLQ